MYIPLYQVYPFESQDFYYEPYTAIDVECLALPGETPRSRNSMAFKVSNSYAKQKRKEKALPCS